MKEIQKTGVGGERLSRKYRLRTRPKGDTGSQADKPMSGIQGCSHNFCSVPRYVEYVQKNKTSWEISYSKTIDISRIRMYSFCVINNGPKPAVIQAELSPDGLLWEPFGEMGYVIEAGGKRIFTPQYFLRYARIKYRSWGRGYDTFITIWFQGQS